MPKIQQLSAHVANLIAAGEVVERPGSVVKELLENAVDAGASPVAVELQDGGMTFLRVTDNGCGMTAEDARIAFLRHATSKLRTEEDLAAIGTMGFRGEALAAIASVSRIDLMTKTAGSLAGTSLHLDAGQITEESEVGCPEGTTIIVRNLFYNTPARMKFMKSDSVEGSFATGVVQKQAMAHPQVAFRLLRDGKEILNTPGDGKLLSAIYAVLGREAASMIPVDSHWEKTAVTGYVSKPTDARANRAFQLFFVNGRPVKSKLLQAALEEAYRNQIMVGRFPSCVLHITLPPNAVDVNVHPAKTEVKFLAERSVFDCVHYGVLAALKKTADRPAVHFPGSKPEPTTVQTSPAAPRQENFFRTMTAQEYKSFATALAEAPKPEPAAARQTAAVLEREQQPVLAQRPMVPVSTRQAAAPAAIPPAPAPAAAAPAAPKPVSAPRPAPVPPPAPKAEPEQAALELPQVPSYRIVGELFRCYILVEQGQTAYLIDKHAAHERILFDKLRSGPRQIASQSLLIPVTCALGEEASAILLANRPLLDELGYEAEEFGEGTLAIRRIPMDLAAEQASETLAQLANDLLEGRREDRDTLRDNLLHTIACRAAIKGGWHTDPRELEALVRQVMSREDLKYCPHGRPICIQLSQGQLDRQFKR